MMSTSRRVSARIHASVFGPADLRGRIRPALLPALGVGAFLTLHGLSFWVANAQQAPAAGEALITGFSESLETTGLRLSQRHFDAGARSAWHSHANGQLLFVKEGRARTQKRSGDLREMVVGESDYTGPGVEHWHGATPDSHFVQVAVSFGGATTWFDYVTDEEYEGR